jgi:hypothetical protein
MSKQVDVWLELEARVLLAKFRVLSDSKALTLAIEISHALGAIAARTEAPIDPSPLLACEAELFAAWSSGYRAGSAITVERRALCGIVAAVLRLEPARQRADVDELFRIFDEIGQIVAAHGDAPLPIIGAHPDLVTVVVAGRKYRDGEVIYLEEVKKEKIRRDERKAAHEKWVASLPSAEELMEMASKAKDPFNFKSYDLWREGDGWSLTNAYGCDNCAYLSSIRDFEWLLSTIKAGVEIGPVPPGCEGGDDSDEDEVDFDYWLDYNGEISDHAYRLAGKVPEEFYPQGADSGELEKM